MDATDRVYCFNQKDLEFRLSEIKKYWGWSDGDIKTARLAFNAFLLATRQSLLIISKIPEGLDEADPERGLKYWFDIFVTKNLIQCIWKTDDSAAEFFGIKDKLSAMILDEIRPHPDWQVVESCSKEPHSIWFASDMTFLTAAAWIYCDQDDYLYKKSQAKVLARYRQISKFEGGFSPADQFASILKAAIDDSGQPREDLKNIQNLDES